jgi:catechol 2,3-dioxygenase-like lactoylglutathione lyase family enzyme
MPKLPSFAMIVSDLAASVTFYVNRLGFTLLEQRPEADMAQLIDYDGDPILFAGPKVEDVRVHLSEPRLVFKPGETLTYQADDLVAREAMLREQGISGMKLEESSLGDRTLAFKDPDGYIVAFFAPAQRTPEVMIALYSQGPDELQEALAGLAEADLDVSLEDGSWTIRQNVHHLAESESLFLMHFKTALADSGRTFIRPPYDQALWSQSLEYTKRPIGPSLALIKASHSHISQLLHYVPDNWEKYVMMKYTPEQDEGRKTTVNELVNMMVRHMREHCDEIREIRRVHGL